MLAPLTLGGFFLALSSSVQILPPPWVLRLNLFSGLDSNNRASDASTNTAISATGIHIIIAQAPTEDSGAGERDLEKKDSSVRDGSMDSQEPSWLYLSYQDTYLFKYLPFYS
jgi:hypothetical protein